MMWASVARADPADEFGAAIERMQAAVNAARDAGHGLPQAEQGAGRGREPDVGPGAGA